MAKKIEIEDIKKMSDELSALYSKAKTREEYQKVVELRELYANTLKANLMTPETIISVILPGYWAEYYLLLKFPAEVTEEDKYDFMGMITNKLMPMSIPRKTEPIFS